MIKLLRSQSGDTLVEVAIALAILAVTLTSAFNVATLSYRVGTSSRERTEAVSIAGQQAEMLRQYRDAVQAGGAGTYPIAVGSPWHMDPSGATIAPSPGEGNAAGSLYYVGITYGPGPVPAPSPPLPAGNLALLNYIITVHWKPAIGDSSGTDNQVVLKLSLADRNSFVLKPCEDATVPECSNLVYP